MHAAPFQLRRSLEVGALVQLRLCLRLTEAADEDRRLVNAKLDLDLTERMSAERVITFTTQARLIEASDRFTTSTRICDEKEEPCDVLLPCSIARGLVL